jgi:hypothetical protein
VWSGGGRQRFRNSPKPDPRSFRAPRILTGSAGGISGAAESDGFQPQDPTVPGVPEAADREGPSRPSVSRVAGPIEAFNSHSASSFQNDREAKPLTVTTQMPSRSAGTSLSRRTAKPASPPRGGTLTDLSLLPAKNGGFTDLATAGHFGLPDPAGQELHAVSATLLQFAKVSEGFAKSSCVRDFHGSLATSLLPTLTG